MLGQDCKSCGATRLDIVKTMPTLRVPSYAGICLRSALLRLAYSAWSHAFPRALGSPFGPALFAAFPPPAALSGRECETYSLFFNGLVKHNTPCFICQQEFFILCDFFKSVQLCIAAAKTETFKNVPVFAKIERAGGLPSPLTPPMQNGSFTKQGLSTV